MRKEDAMTSVNWKRVMLLLVMGVAVIQWGTACKNTANGAGRDIEKMGEKIQEKTQ